MEEPPRKKLRKGTRSCLECRRRKSKCTYKDGQGFPPCDGCRSRQTICESQDQTQSASQIREPTRERVDRLEVIVSNLSNTVAELQRSSREPESVEDPSLAFSGDEDACEGCGNEEYCHSPNGLHAEAASLHEAVHENQPSCVTSARERLLAMVPSREDVLTITASAVDWWAIHNTLFPEPSVKSRVELVELHSTLDDPDTVTADIAAWLVYFAITFLQLPNSFDISMLGSITDTQDLVSNVNKEVEPLLLKDNEIGSLPGLKCAAIFAQLQKMLGRPKKGWIMLRRAITFAELMNLHSAKKALKLAKKFSQGATHTTASLPSLAEKTKLWSSLCAIDRLLSLLLGLPTAASNINTTTTEMDLSDPHAATRRIVWVQSDIADQIFHRDQIEDHVEAYQESQNITEKLRALQKTWPADWSNFDRWASYDQKSAACMLFQTGHSFLVLRVSLPYLLKAKEYPKYNQNAIDCLQACREILKRYYAVRTRLNVGGFMSRSFDVHAFTASVILLLHHDGSILHMSTTDQALLENAKEAMRQAPEKAGMQLTQTMIVGLNSIQMCLDGDTASPESVSLKVPLLGDVTIKRQRLMDEVESGETAVGERAKSNIAFNFDSLDDEWFTQDSECI